MNRISKLLVVAMAVVAWSIVGLKAGSSSQKEQPSRRDSQHDERPEMMIIRLSAQRASLFHTSSLPTLATDSQTVAYFPGYEVRTTARGSSFEFVLKMMNAAKIRSVTLGMFDKSRPGASRGCRCTMSKAISVTSRKTVLCKTAPSPGGSQLAAF
jgi:hypothetical protein